MLLTIWYIKRKLNYYKYVKPIVNTLPHICLKYLSNLQTTIYTNYNKTSNYTIPKIFIKRLCDFSPIIEFLFIIEVNIFV